MPASMYSKAEDAKVFENVYSTTPNQPNWYSTNGDLRYDGFLKHTFDQVFNDTNRDFVFGMYNDEVPDKVSKSDVWYGHMKGLLAFPENNRADHLVISRPLIQSFQLPESIGELIPKLKDIFNHKPEKNASLFLSTFLDATQSDLVLRLFTKSRKFHQDLYSDLVAPNLKVPLFAETWRHTASNLPSNCTTEYWVKNIEKLKWPKSMKVKFKSTQDHSKWTVSVNEEGDKWTCFGDINRSWLKRQNALT
ncbi:hypothetical protein ACTXT7_012881 [Hymenolepis weldensis]